MTAPDETTYLPKEPLDLPRERLDLPTPELALPAAHTETARKQTIHHEKDADERYSEVKTLLAWHAPGRPFRQRKKEYFFNMLLIVIALEIIIFLFHDYTLMALVLCVGFLSAVLAYVKPHDFYYKISTEGIMVEDHFFLWQELYDFYFKSIHGEDVLIVRTDAYFPGELTITLGSIHKTHVKSVLLPYLPYREYVKPTFVEKSGDWLANTFPLEKNDG